MDQTKGMSAKAQACRQNPFTLGRYYGWRTLACNSLSLEDPNPKRFGIAKNLVLVREYTSCNKIEE